MPTQIRLPLLASILLTALSLHGASPIKDLNTPREFPNITSKDAWQARARQIREQVLVSCGLWPMPEKTPLKTQITGRIERDGYSIEKVSFQTFPGFYLGGNLYRPLGKGKGPFPAILNPHGHWSNGRMADNKDGSIAGRCINFARQGMIAFSYDMVGYNDTFFPNYGDVPAEQFYIRHRRFATNEANLLWNISLMGLQTWNSIRALDFLASLPDADQKRLACTGESGGGTQTFMLGAIDDRLAAQAPVVMVSHTMQGGCLCENAPGLRVEYSNMEIAASPAPRPQILVAASGDWTKDTLTVEGPSIQGIYRLFNAADRMHFVRYDFDHNYNQTSREAVYGWFNKWLLRNASSAPVRESSFAKEPDQELRVWPDGHLPADARTDSELIDYLKAQFTRQLQAALPTSKRSMKRFKQLMEPAWKHTLQIEQPLPPATSSKLSTSTDGDLSLADHSISSLDPRGASLRARLLTPKSATLSELVIVAGPDTEVPEEFAKRLARKGIATLLLLEYSSTAAPDQFSNFYSVYNRTKAQRRVADLQLACTFARTTLGASKVIVCGEKTAGLWALLAAPAADAVMADCCNLDVTNEHALLAVDIFYPGFLKTGGFLTSALLAAPHPLMLYNTARSFPTSELERAYTAVGARAKPQITAGPIEEALRLSWLSAQNRRGK